MLRKLHYIYVLPGNAKQRFEKKKFETENTYISLTDAGSYVS